MPIASGKIGYYIWIICVALAVAFTLIFLVGTYREYSTLGASAMKDGKRVLVDVETGKIIRSEQEKGELQEEQQADENKQEAVQNQEQVKRNDPAYFGKGKIAIMLVGVGKNQRYDGRIYSSSFPMEVGLVYSPYDQDIAANVSKAVENGREAYIHLPLETTDYPGDDPGHLAILSYYKTERIQDYVKQILQMSEGYKGVIGSIGEVITKETLVITPLLQMLKRYDVPFIYKERPVNISLKDDALDLGLPIIYSYHVIDDIMVEEEIDALLGHWTKEFQIAGRNILLVGRVSELTISRVQKWIEELKKEGIKLSFVSELIRQ